MAGMSATPVAAEEQHDEEDQIQDTQAADNKQEIIDVAEASQDHDVTEVADPNPSQQEDADPVPQDTIQPPTQAEQPGAEPQQAE